jgi:2,3-bisphosphoglycerate-dependent phosphoglycerate mutase
MSPTSTCSCKDLLLLNLANCGDPRYDPFQLFAGGSQATRDLQYRLFITRRVRILALTVFLVRHGQSGNNALAERYLATGNGGWQSYWLERSPDPPLTDVGIRQTRALAKYLTARETRSKDLDDPGHSVAHQSEAGLQEISQSKSENGFLLDDHYRFSHVYCSPMLRAMQTAQPIGQALGLQPEVWVEIHEHGGLFSHMAGNQHGDDITGHPGLSRSEMLDRFPGYFLPPAVSETGWWTQTREEMSGCHARAIAVARRLTERAAENGNDRIALVSHGTFLDSLLKALLHQLPGDHFHYDFFNTSISRVDLSRDNHLSLRYTNQVHHLSRDLLTR